MYFRACLELSNVLPCSTGTRSARRKSGLLEFVLKKDDAEIKSHAAVSHKYDTVERPLVSLGSLTRIFVFLRAFAYLQCLHAYLPTRYILDSS